MPLEIERKFLLKQEEWKKITPSKSVFIRQAYIHSDLEKTIRVRVADNNAYLTIKGASTGISRLEFEYEIPLDEANELINNLTNASIEKMRHYVSYENKIWEIDEFKGTNKGLFIAEVELSSEDESIIFPAWIAKEVSGDRRYSNSNLIHSPYKNWDN